MLFQSTFLLALASSAAAHMILKYPVPYGNASLNNSPLAPGDYPCKQRPGVYDITEMNQWNAGETKTIAFYGTVVHGGGSCQFSLTTDPEPSESTQWKVITSVIGGCPSNVSGNIDPAGEYKEVAATYPVTMPDNIPDGQYTFAWSWLNKVGNREFYMNCAPVQVGNAAGKASTASVAAALSPLPDMFVANLPGDQCATAEHEDFVYPDPGQNVIKGDKATFGTTLNGAGCAKMTKLGAGNGQLGSPTQGETPSKPEVSEKPAATSPASYPEEPAVPSSPGGVFAPGASSGPAADPVSEPTAPAPAVPTAAPTQQPTYGETPKAPENETAPSGPISNGECTPCTNDGAVVCIGAKQFGLCNRGCAVAQDLAFGMSCSNGAVVASTKRSISFPRAHLHRRHGSSRFL